MFKPTILMTAMAVMFGVAMGSPAAAQDMSAGANNFYQSDKVSQQRVSFETLYGTTVVGSLFIPNSYDSSQQLPAIIVGHPMGAVKEQSATLYATKMAEQGFVTLAIDLPFWGESDGAARQVVAPDFYTEAFSAGVDFLGTHAAVDRNRIGGLGICGSGGFVISAAKIDSRLQAIATVSMYDMGQTARNGLNDSVSLQQRQQTVAQASQQRYVEYNNGAIEYTSGTVHELTENTHPIQREFYDFYRTSRGEYTPVSSEPELTTHPTLTSNVKFINFYPFNDLSMISPRPLLLISGDQAHSKEFSEDAYARAEQPKELYWVEGAGHVDLYDRVDLIPFNKLSAFFTENLD